MTIPFLAPGEQAGFLVPLYLNIMIWQVGGEWAMETLLKFKIEMCAWYMWWCNNVVTYMGMIPSCVPFCFVRDVLQGYAIQKMKDLFHWAQNIGIVIKFGIVVKVSGWKQGDCEF